MRTLIATLTTCFVLLVNINVQAASDDVSVWPEQIIDTMDGARLVVFMPSDEIADSPGWLPDRQIEPPLTIGQAIAKLNRWLSEEGKGENVEISSIELKPIKHFEKQHRWYYLFHLHAVSHGNSKTMYAAVLLNGAVFAAIVEPASVS